jgi:hypothetical protein
LERRPLQFNVKYHYLPPSLTPPSTHTLNLTSKGACIETVDPLQDGAVIAFFIITPNHQVIDVRARVVHSEEARQTPFRAGVSFTYLSQEDREMLEQVLKSTGA